MGEREALACLLACEGWHTYLYSRQFVLRTDYQALTVLLSSEGSGHRPLQIHRWFDGLNQYNFGVQYRPGKQNQVADFLSRASGDLPNTECAVGGETFRVVCQYLDSVVTSGELRQESEKDPILQRCSQLSNF